VFAATGAAWREKEAMELRKLARRAVSTHPKATALEVSKTMITEGVGAVVVDDGGRLVGIVSERDVVSRVVVMGRDPEKTLVSEIMTADVRTITEGLTIESALELMHRGRFRHLPVVDAAGKVVGMLSVRDVLRDRVGELSLKNEDLVAFISTDGAGG
jgi:CBS domain-containing protein